MSRVATRLSRATVRLSPITKPTSESSIAFASTMVCTPSELVSAMPVAAPMMVLLRMTQFAVGSAVEMPVS
jgi:hypothetical protein